MAKQLKGLSKQQRPWTCECGIEMRWENSACRCGKPRWRPDKAAEIKKIRDALKELSSDPYVDSTEDEIIWEAHMLMTVLERFYETKLRIIRG